VSLEDFTMTTLNVQSVASHFPDFSMDQVLTSTDILAVTETWLDNSETAPLNGYKCIIQFKRQDVRAGGVAIYEEKK
jgi:hypothetical protein